SSCPFGNSLKVQARCTLGELPERVKNKVNADAFRRLVPPFRRFSPYDFPSTPLHERGVLDLLAPVLGEDIELARRVLAKTYAVGEARRPEVDPQRGQCREDGHQDADP